MIKLPHGIKAKNLPLEVKVFLRLISASERAKKQGDAKVLSKELKAPFGDILKALTSLSQTHQAVNITPTSVNEFTFSISGDITKWRSLAKGYDRSLTSQYQKANHVLAPAQAPPPHLPPITEEQRTISMDKAVEFAKALRAEHSIKKIANCICRIGLDEVNKIVDSVVDQRRNSKPGDPSSVRLFFETYTVRRDQLIPATK